MNPFARVPIVVPVDFSEEAGRALDMALELADDPAAVHALHVCPPNVLYEPAGASAIDREQVHRERLDAFRKHYPGARYEAVQFDVRFCDPAEEICEYASQLGAGLIVIATHPHGGLAHLLFSSTAERVQRSACCPVLVSPSGATQ